MIAVASPIPDEPPRISAQRSRSSVIRGLLGWRLAVAMGTGWFGRSAESISGTPVGRPVSAVVQRLSRRPQARRDGRRRRSPAVAAILVGVNTTQILLLAVPIVILELALIVFALRDLLRPERRVRGDSKVMWGIIVVVFGIIGPVLYFLVGREEG